MTNLTKLFDYEGNKVTFKTVEGVVYVNATQMAKVFGKRPNDYLNLPTTKELLMAITRKSGTSENQYVISKMGSPDYGGGTWLHEDIALDFAQWLSVDFRLWCNDHIKQLLTTGSTSIAAETKLPSIKELAQMVIEAENAREEAEKKLAIQQPRVDYATQVLNSTSFRTTNEIAMDFGMTAQKLNRMLNQKGIQYFQNGRWMLYSQYRSSGYAKNHTDVKNGHTFTYMVWSEKGRAFIHSILNPIMIASIQQKNLIINRNIN